ncbi:type IV secretory system conjugative DNA transfer family protein [Rhizobium tubonense]|uniref:Uncharacterized protein n=1 Tax=Rhizobium tubonense TaxID=484088 RepID=A0A2W4C5G8_9HYPH|nr:type IV secretory system conjugative DNA transfer family protein [Rhizobium tubonense]PZM08919.1 hypothetical protein CPY51_27305 [Rhizobium tubonense]
MPSSSRVRSGICANAVKETRWLSCPNNAALVSRSSFATDDLAAGNTASLSHSTSRCWTHTRVCVVIGARMNAIYNRNVEVTDRTSFLLDQVARLGNLRMLETARDAGRKYGIALTCPAYPRCRR